MTIPANHPISVDVVVPVFGGWEYAQECIRALLAQTVTPQIIVVDDASPDDTADRIATAFPQVRLVRNETNSGFAVACNRGIVVGHGDIVILLNSDVVAAPDMVAQIAQAFAGDEADSLGSVAPLLLRQDGRVDALGVCVDATLAGFLRFHGASPDGTDVETTDQTSTDQAAPRSAGPYGALAAYRRRALDAVGLLDEHLFMYGEELELALRLSVGGWMTSTIAAPLGTHIGGATVGVRSPRQRSLAGFGRGYILRRYGILRSRHALRAVLTELLVVVAGLVLRRDVAALTGRVAGWRRAGDLPRLPYPDAAIATEIGFIEAMRMRRPSYWADRAATPAAGRSR